MCIECLESWEDPSQNYPFPDNLVTLQGSITSSPMWDLKYKYTINHTSVNNIQWVLNEKYNFIFNSIKFLIQWIFWKSLKSILKFQSFYIAPVKSFTWLIERQLILIELYAEYFLPEHRRLWQNLWTNVSIWNKKICLVLTDWNFKFTNVRFSSKKFSNEEIQHSISK